MQPGDAALTFEHDPGELPAEIHAEETGENSSTAKNQA
jgi:hypothetical protein